MKKPSYLVPVMLAMLVGTGIAGCLEGADPATRADADGPDDESGSLSGTVTDDELRPLPGARIQLANVNTSSDAAGDYALPEVPAGNWTLIVEREGYHPHVSDVVIGPGQHVTRDLRLGPLPTVDPHRVTTPFEGKYECTWEFLIIGGDCLVLYEEFTGEPDPVTNDTYAFRLPVLAGWESVVMEMTWQSDATNQFDGMRLYLEHGNGSKTGHATTVGRADGDENPLSFVVHRGTPHPRAEYYEGTDQKAQIPDGGEVAQVRVFPHGKLYEVTSHVCPEPGRCLLGVGVGVDIRFTVYATVFYHERAPAGFTAVPSE